MFLSFSKFVYYSKCLECLRLFQTELRTLKKSLISILLILLGQNAGVAKSTIKNSTIYFAVILLYTFLILHEIEKQRRPESLRTRLRTVPSILQLFYYLLLILYITLKNCDVKSIK